MAEKSKNKVRYDSFGRRIPEFDRHAAALKAAKTKKEMYGEDFFKEMGKKKGKKKIDELS